jgi:hypothetical protein
MPRALSSISASVYAEMTPEPGRRIVANDIQNAPYDVNATE